MKIHNPERTEESTSSNTSAGRKSGRADFLLGLASAGLLCALPAVAANAQTVDFGPGDELALRHLADVLDASPKEWDRLIYTLEKSGIEPVGPDVDYRNPKIVQALHQRIGQASGVLLADAAAYETLVVLAERVAGSQTGFLQKPSLTPTLTCAEPGKPKLIMLIAVVLVVAAFAAAAYHLSRPPKKPKPDNP